MAATILVVEDEHAVARGLQYALQQEGYEVTLARSGEEGLESATREAPDLILLDVRLPGMDGFEVLRRLRAAGTKSPVLMLTARDEEVDKVIGLELGADDYLTKPFSFVVLLARLRAMLRRGAEPRPASLSAGDLVLDPAARTVHRGDEAIELTPREFSLLEYLMRHAGQAVPKAEILHHVWDSHYAGDANVVEVYVGYLRRKIDTPFERHAVRTVRGAGYRLEADGG
jgi:DNA-binding response OmpR family regulator